jgi:DNA-binding protein HU-beta
LRHRSLRSELGLTGWNAVSSLAHFPTPMNKATLVDEVQKILSNGTSKASAERATEAVLAAVKRGLRRDKEVSLVGFGTFALAVRPARNGFNPHTKQPMKIRAIKTVRFKPGAELRALG